MDDSWTDSGAQRELFFDVDVYLSLKTINALRKHGATRKKSEKRDSRSLSIMTDDAQKRVKEKPSWLNLSRGSNADHWRRATCRMTEEGKHCILNVYLDGTLLFQTVHIHLLECNNIRPGDPSLFFRNHILGIHCTTYLGQRWSATQSTEPLYLALPSSEALHTWIMLLRSYAQPEVHGQVSTSDDGLYRMWRQVNVTCSSGRGLSRPLIPDESHKDQEDQEVVDLDVFCEIYFNQILTGRTSVKRCNGSPEWHERFVFGDLPKFEQLTILVLEEKKTARPYLLGSTQIPLVNFRRGETVDGWFPVLANSSKSACLQTGQIRLTIQVDEHYILPLTSYGRVLDELDRHNYLFWISQFESALQISHATVTLASIAASKDILLKHILAEATRTVDDTSQAHNTLFRGNTALTKSAELFMAWHGKNFLEQSLGNTIRRICVENVCLEVDPSRGGSTRDTERLIYWCSEAWTEIYQARSECPHDFRLLFKHVRELVAQRYSQQQKNLHLQSVNAFCFLRFFIPAILNPQLHGLFPGVPDPRVQRSLTLIAKTLQSLANLNTSVQNEELMGGVKTFLEESRPQMLEYIHSITSTHSNSSKSTPHSDEWMMQQRALRVLRERKRKMPALQQEALSVPPHFIDLPLHLAIICKSSSNSVSPPLPTSLEKLLRHSLDVEKEASRRISSAVAIRSDLSYAQSMFAPYDYGLPDEGMMGEGLLLPFDGGSGANALNTPNDTSTAQSFSSSRINTASDPVANNPHARSPSSSSVNYERDLDTVNEALAAPPTDSATEITYEPKTRRTFLRNLGWK